MIRFFYILFFFFFFQNCSKERKIVNEQEYLQWQKKHQLNLIKEKQIDDITIKVTLIPTESIYLQNKTEETTINDYKGMLAFKVELINKYSTPMLKYKISNDKDYQSRIYYYTNEIKKKIVLKQEGQEDIIATDVIMDRNYGIKPSLTLNILFNNIYLNHAITLHYEDEIYNLGKLNFHYNKKELNSIPTLEEPSI